MIALASTRIIVFFLSLGLSVFKSFVSFLAVTSISTTGHFYFILFYFHLIKLLFFYYLLRENAHPDPPVFPSISS
jgi:hypothetical protein